MAPGRPRRVVVGDVMTDVVVAVNDPIEVGGDDPFGREAERTMLGDGS